MTSWGGPSEHEWERGWRDPFPVNLLGRTGVFNEFEVCFNDRALKVSFQELSSRVLIMTLNASRPLFVSHLAISGM